MKFGRVIEHDIKIHPSMNNGFIVIVGCAKLVYSDKDKLIDALAEYLTSPEEITKKYNEQYGNMPAACVQQAEPRNNV